MIERQVIVTWHTPEERLPQDDVGVIATISGEAHNIRFNHAMVNLYYCEEEGWYSTDYDFSELTVHAWCDLKPYGGDDNERKRTS